MVASGILLVAVMRRLPAKETGTAEAIAAPSKAVAADAKLYDRSWVGPLADGRVIVPTNQILSPAGRQVVVGGRPTDVALSPDKKWLAVLNVNEVQLVDVESDKILSHVAIQRRQLQRNCVRAGRQAVYASSMKGGIVVLESFGRGQTFGGQAN